MILEIPIEHYLVCWVGSFILYFQLKTKNKPVLKVLPHINENWEDKPIALFIDALFITTVGALIGTIATQPINAQQAIAAGLGWTGLLSIVGD